VSGDKNVCYNEIMIFFESKKEQIGKIAKKYGLDMIVLFGSQATGQTHAKSDVDFGYTSSQHLESETRFKIQNELSDFLHREDIEFVDLRRISPVMKKIVADEGVVLYERAQGMFVLFRMYAFKLYVETRPLRDLRYQSLKNFVYGTV